MATPRKTAPILWPSLSNLASQLYGEARGLDTLGREVRRLHVKTRKIGRELRIEPHGAVQVLEARGLTLRQATESVARAVTTRSREVPALAMSTSSTSMRAERRTDPYASMNPALSAALQEYEKRTFGTLPAALLPNDVPTDIPRTADLVRAVGGGE